VNFRRDNPMFRSSIRWVLSLNCLSQKWGQVHTSGTPIARFSYYV
jgi:hypothetical protein